MTMLTQFQQVLLDSIRTCCKVYPGEILPSTNAEIHRAMQYEDFLVLVAGGLICLAQIGESWNIWVVNNHPALLFSKGVPV